ncbi:MAG: tetratricopeptide repeat protein, partial [Paramuribaculum sp.]|nr:tetratricopeptide repeat protein [Paramuribaculum sp.]
MNRHIITLLLFFTGITVTKAQINTDQVMQIGRNALYFEDYVVSIQYFNQVIAAKPYLAQPYFFRALAKFNLDDLKGAEQDVSMAIERNPFITDAYELRGVVRQNLGMDSLAIADYAHALTLLPENKGILYNMALAQESTKDYDNAEKSFGQLLNAHPGFDGGYLGRAKMRLEKADTTGAMEDIEKALSINKNSVNGYLMRADIAIHRNEDYAQALTDMDEAIRLQPRVGGYYINRAFIRYRLDDYIGAMNDYDYALLLEPTNFVAVYNRALLRMEVHDYNRAIDDLSQVLALRPHEYRALFNRAMLYREIGDFRHALDDINRVIDEIPNFALAYYLRYDVKKSMGMKASQADLDKSIALAKRQKAKEGLQNLIDPSRILDRASSAEETFDPNSEDAVARQFSTLLTISDNATVDREFNNKNIRGKIQDQSVTIELEPMFTIT